MSKPDTVRYCLHGKGAVPSNWFKTDPKSCFSGNILFTNSNSECELLNLEGPVVM